MFLEGGSSAEGEVNVDAGTPESQSKEVKGSSPLLPIGLGPGQECGGAGTGDAQVGVVPAGFGGSAGHEDGSQG